MTSTMPASDPTKDPTDRDLKTRHRTMWGTIGHYPTVAIDLIPELGPRLVEAVGIGPGDRVLDVAAGTGNTAVPAAITGAEVVASDLAPELFEAGRAFAARHDVTVTWEEGDAEHLPYDDDAFDAVVSSVGVMFAPRHQRTADELVRVCRPGGRIGLINWTPTGFVGEMFKIMKPYAPPPPPGAQPGPLWGDEHHVRELFGDRVTDVVARRETVAVGGFASPSDWLQQWKQIYGPTIIAYRNADAQDRTGELDRELTDLATRFDRGTGDTVLDWEYLLVTARVTG